MVRSSFPWFPFSLFDELARGGLLAEQSAGGPPVELLAGERGLLVRASLPGIDPATLSVELEGDVLRLRAERPSPAPESGSVLARELGQGEVSLALRLGFRPDRASVTASYEDGILVLDLPRSAEERAHSIPVTTR